MCLLLGQISTTIKKFLLCECECEFEKKQLDWRAKNGKFTVIGNIECMYWTYWTFRYIPDTVNGILISM